MKHKTSSIDIYKCDTLRLSLKACLKYEFLLIICECANKVLKLAHAVL